MSRCISSSRSSNSHSIRRAEKTAATDESRIGVRGHIYSYASTISFLQYLENKCDRRRGARDLIVGRQVKQTFPQLSPEQKSLTRAPSLRAISDPVDDLWFRRGHHSRFDACGVGSAPTRSGDLPATRWAAHQRTQNLYPDPRVSAPIRKSRYLSFLSWPSCLAASRSALLVAVSLTPSTQPANPRARPSHATSRRATLGLYP